MVLGFKQPPMADSYWYGHVAGANRKLCRVLCGACLPISGMQRGAIVALGEIFRAAASPEWYVLGVTAGEWSTMEKALVTYRRNLKFNVLVTDTGEAAHIIKRIPGLQYGQGEIPLLQYVAPRAAFTEAGKQRVDSLVDEGRLHLLDDVKHVLDAEPEPGMRAVRAAVIWGLDHRAAYCHRAKRQPEGRPLGTVGL